MPEIGAALAKAANEAEGFKSGLKIEDHNFKDLITLTYPV